MKSSLSSSSLLSSSTFTGSVTVGVERMFNYLMPFHSLHRLLAECVCVCVCLSLLHHFSTSSVYLLLALRLLLDLSTSPHITSFSILSSGILHYMTEQIQLLPSFYRAALNAWGGGGLVARKVSLCLSVHLSACLSNA